ncbi:unnamed protein product [Heligmosomoides polygyrus]|uniref:Retrotransposon gag domain-containing protein n=1 Tax=Heligmosomoides polygyrus TaxID=6339 RepID=A0A183GV55_HELPZ|nr:unnamed protein product [Heligmosomoides polygyrus]
MVRILPAHLRDVAKAIFDNFDDATKINWRAAITKLKEHFSSERFLDIAREKITDMKMCTGEAPVMFSNTVKRDILEAFPGTDQATHRVFLQNMVFTSGLLDTIKRKLKLLGPLSSNYDQLVKDAERMWNFIRTDGSTHDNGTLIAKIDQVLETLSSQPRVVNYVRPSYNNSGQHPSRSWQHRYDNNNSNYSRDRYRCNGFDRSPRYSAFQARSRTPPRQRVHFAPNQGYESQP